MSKPVLGILGAGKLGTTLARLAIAADYKVLIAGSGDPEKIALSIQVITPGAKALHAADVIAESDITILALPLGKVASLDAYALRGKLVIDAMNYWWEVDGELPELKQFPSSSQYVQHLLPDATIVKALSHMGYHNLYDDTRPAGSSNRKAIAIAGDNSATNAVVADLVNDLGFDPVIIGGLADSTPLEPGGGLFGVSTTRAEVMRVTL